MPSQRNPSSQGYGTIEDASARDQADGIGQRNTAEDNSDQPNRGLTNTTKDSDNPSFPRQLHRRMIVDVDTRWADLVLILCHYASGLVDSVAYNTYSCFASMQTGNTILVGLGLVGEPSSEPSFGWTKSLTAILCFALGALFFSSYHRLLSPLRRWVLVSSFAIQALLIAVVAILGNLKVISNQIAMSKNFSSGTQVGLYKHTVHWMDLVPISLLAFQSAGQVVASRVLKYNELPTVVLTSLIADLMSDAHLLTAGLFEDHKRNRRAAAVVMQLAGAICGGVFTKGWIGFAGAMWVAAAVKGVIVVAWLVWAPKIEITEDNSVANGQGQ